MPRFLGLLATGLGLVAVAASCGGLGGTTPTSAALSARQCPLIGNCSSPDGDWRLKITNRAAPCELFMAHRGSAGGVRRYRIRGAYCSYVTWTKPHLLDFIVDYRLFTLDPATRKLRVLASLSDFRASPNSARVAGLGPGDIYFDPVATTVYVLSVHDGSCRVVPGSSEDIQGFTSDGKNVIVVNMQGQYRQFAISSLPSDCPVEVLRP